jgi:hypothetical protein
MTPSDRFWAKVDKSGDCWLWTSTRSGNGYGQFWLDGRYRPAHQVAWEIATGRDFPLGMQACHTCDTPLCVRPDHLFVGTPADNQADKVDKGRQFRPIGELHPNRVLSDERVRQIRRMRLRGLRQSAIAAEIGCHQSTVSLVLSGHIWSHVDV